MILDQSGSLANLKRHDYLPFGEELGSGVGGRTIPQGYAAGDGVRQKFTQKERDNETGLDYFGARYHSPIQGRFVSADPLSVAPLLSGAIRRPQGWNAYTYVLNRPLKYEDPAGLRWTQRSTHNGGIQYRGYDTDSEYDAAIDASSATYEGWTAVSFDESKAFTVITGESNDGLFITVNLAQLNPNGRIDNSRLTFYPIELVVETAFAQLFGSSYLNGKRHFQTTIADLFDSLPAVPLAAGNFPSIPKVPGRMTPNAFGSDVMKWGTGDEAARSRIASLTREELKKAGVTREMAEQWRDFYREVARVTPGNPSAAWTRRFNATSC